LNLTEKVFNFLRRGELHVVEYLTFYNHRRIEKYLAVPTPDTPKQHSINHSPFSSIQQKLQTAQKSIQESKTFRIWIHGSKIKGKTILAFCINQC
jgi:hypothetical protein